MKSRITIEVDFDNGNLPVIQILSTDSDDVRDRLIKQFLQSLQHTSRWCKIDYMGEFGATSADPRSLASLFQKWRVSPITVNQLLDEYTLMKSILEANGETEIQWAVVADQRDAEFEEYLQKTKIPYMVDADGIFIQSGTELVNVIKRYRDFQKIKREGRDPYSETLAFDK